ncbi:MAG TPA: ATP-binding protein, partial [Verrucomicrobiae bacterium]|nr:ATP-binding protein [Verrucomicrobiae bacterium]
RHAGASSVWIRLRLEPDRFVLEIEDNGRGLAGLDEKKARSRNGLSNMRKRLEEIGGRFTASTGSEGGALIQLIGPLRQDKIDGNGAGG